MRGFPRVLDDSFAEALNEDVVGGQNVDTYEVLCANEADFNYPNPRYYDIIGPGTPGGSDIVLRNGTFGYPRSVCYCSSLNYVPLGTGPSQRRGQELESVGLHLDIAVDFSEAFAACSSISAEFRPLSPVRLVVFTINETMHPSELTLRVGNLIDYFTGLVGGGVFRNYAFRPEEMRILYERSYFPPTPFSIGLYGSHFFPSRANGSSVEKDTVYIDLRGHAVNFGSMVQINDLNQRCNTAGQIFYFFYSDAVVRETEADFVVYPKCYLNSQYHYVDLSKELF